MVKYLYVRDNKVTIEREEWERLQQWEMDILETGQFYQKATYWLWLLAQKVPLDECLLIQMLQSENDHLIERLREMSGDIKTFERLIENINNASSLDEVKLIIKGVLE